MNHSSDDKLSMSATTGPRRREGEYPASIVVPPGSGHHAQSFIILHGIGSNGDLFGKELLDTPIPGYQTLQNAYRNARFIFPTASKRQATIWKTSLINQWFDGWSLQTPEEREELQTDGLRESSVYIHGLLHAEIAVVGPDNVVLWGLSQGCAISLTALLLWEGPKIAGAIGMCGWLPLRKRIEEMIQANESAGDETDPFSTSNGSGSEDDNATQSNIDTALEFLREELDLPKPQETTDSLLRIPVFLGHGTEDEKVPIELDRKAQALFNTLGFDVCYNEYQNLGHWYSGQMLADIIEFLTRKTAVAATRQDSGDRPA